MCGKAAVPIVYGFPGSVDVFEGAERGELVLGGCIVSDVNPTDACLTCGHEWRAQRERSRRSTSFVSEDGPEWPS